MRSELVLLLCTGPSVGDITLHSVGGSSSSFGASDNPAALYKQFQETGKFSAAAVGAVAAHGAAAVSTTIGAGETQTLSIVFSWYFPDRDYKASNDKSEQGLILGNYYQNLWGSSLEVAHELANEGRLADVVSDINSHHGVVAHVDNPTPVTS